MPTAISIPESQFERFPAHTVYLREFWSAPWVEEPYLFANRFAKRASPETSRAELEYSYGLIQRTDEGSYELFEELAILGWYVKIVVSLVGEDGEATPINWFGVIEDDGGTRDGAPLDDAGNRIPTGRQTFNCVGMETMLAREPLRRSTCQIAAGGEEDVGRAIGFNVPPGRAHDDLVGNRSEDIGEFGAFIFAAELNAAAQWSVPDIVKYLLTYRTPRNALGDVVVPFELSSDAKVLLPDWDHPRVPIHSESTRAVLDKLISRKRILGWYVDVFEGGLADSVVVFAFSFASAPIDVGLGLYTILANDQQVTLDFDEDVLLREAVVRHAIKDQYDQVVVRGDRKGACFSISNVDGTLESDWPATAETAYVTAASAASDYPPSYPAKTARNKLFRSADTYTRVYSYFDVPESWNGYAANGVGVGPNPVFPVDDIFSESDTFWRPGLIFAPHLPLLTDHDYSGTNIATGSVTDTTPAGQQAERLRPMLFVHGPETYTAGRQWQHGEKSIEVNKTDKHAIGAGQFTCSLRMQDRDLGIVVKVSGAPQHAIASADFTPIDFSDSPGILNWHLDLIATVYVQGDHCLEVRWPLEPPDTPPEPEEEDPDIAAPLSDTVRTLEIDLGTSAKLDYIAPGTVVAIADGQLVQSTGGYVRDDRLRLQYIAEVSFVWYQQPRQAITLVYKTITDVFAIGMLVVSIGSGATLEAVNTPVTGIEWDLVAGTTAITTGYAELDVLQFSGAGDRRHVVGLGAG